MFPAGIKPLTVNRCRSRDRRQIGQSTDVLHSAHVHRDTADSRERTSGALCRRQPCQPDEIGDDRTPPAQR